MKCTDSWKAISWSEHSAPPDEQHCEQCGLYKHGTRMVWGEGNPHAPIMMIMDNPGAREDREGQPFVCGTRQTLQQGMMAAGLPLDEVYITYVLKRRPLRAYDKPAARAACLHHLHRQIAEMPPRLLFGFGNVVSETLLSGDDDRSVKALRGKWLEYRDIPIAFAYHPLAVRRRPNLMPAFVEDLQLLVRRWAGQ